MEINSIVKDILSVSNSKCFKVLHNQYGFDFEGEIGMFRIDGAFTIGTVKKLVFAHGFNEWATCLVLSTTSYFFNNETRGSYKQELQPVSINLHDNTFDNPHMAYFSDYWRKSEFNDLRKRSDAISFVIVQNGDKLKPSKPTKTAWTERFDVVGVVNNRWGENTDEIRYIELKRHGANRNAETKNFYCYAHHYKDAREVIDPSGYMLGANRIQLHKRLEALKEKRARESYAKTDNADKVVAIDALLAAKKTILSQMFADAKTYEDYRNFDSKLYKFRNAVEDAEEFKERTAQKSFESIEASDRAYNYLINQLMA